MQLKMGVKHWWNDIGRVQPKYPEGNLFQYHFVRCLSHMDVIGFEPGPPRWDSATSRQSQGTAFEDQI
jgi:hypothetical protein